jgi:16S rRNA (uracil1498-N3)-methyltransferase
VSAATNRLKPDPTDNTVSTFTPLRPIQPAVALQSLTPAVHRFHAPALEPGDQTIALPEEEAQHLVRVLRVEKGREVLVFNGRGYQCRGRVELADKRGVVLRVAAPQASAPELPIQLTLAQAALKGDKTDDIVRDAVMLGVTAVQPLITRFIDVPAGPLAVGRRVERWQRVAVSSVKQCGRSVVPEIREPASLESALAEARGVSLLLVEPAIAHGSGRRIEDVPRPEASTVFVGPEGGWAPEEIARARAAGAIPVCLGARTLRADAVPIVALSVLLYAWGLL